MRGHVTLRYLGKLRHLNVGWAYREKPIRLYILDDVVTFATDDGEFIGETKINPHRDYQPKGDGFRKRAQVRLFTMSRQISVVEVTRLCSNPLTHLFIRCIIATESLRWTVDGAMSRIG